MGEATKGLSAWKAGLAGAVAGACEVIGTMPLDVVKTRMQINPGLYKHPIDAAVKIFRAGGVPALYYGMPAFLMQTAGKASIRFCAYEQIRLVLNMTVGEKTVKQHEVFYNMIAGLGAGTAEACFWTTPTERLKVLRQTEVGAANPRYTSMYTSVRIILREQGIRGLYVGLVPTAIRQSSSVGFRFMWYDSVKALIGKIPHINKDLTNLLSGGTVGGLSVAANNPVDVIKSMQQSVSGGGKSPGARPLSTWTCAKKIYADSGVSGFYRGLTARVPRVFCGQAITFAVYERMAQLLKQF